MPGTMPPPRTRSNSPMPQGRRGASASSISARVRASPPRARSPVWPAGRRRAGGGRGPGVGGRGLVLFEAVPRAAVGALAHPLGMDQPQWLQRNWSAGFGHRVESGRAEVRGAGRPRARAGDRHSRAAVRWYSTRPGRPGAPGPASGSCNRVARAVSSGPTALPVIGGTDAIRNACFRTLGRRSAARCVPAPSPSRLQPGRAAGGRRDHRGAPLAPAAFAAAGAGAGQADGVLPTTCARSAWRSWRTSVTTTTTSPPRPPRALPTGCRATGSSGRDRPPPARPEQVGRRAVPRPAGRQANVLRCPSDNTDAHAQFFDPPYRFSYVFNLLINNIGGWPDLTGEPDPQPRREDHADRGGRARDRRRQLVPDRRHRRLAGDPPRLPPPARDLLDGHQPAGRARRRERREPRQHRPPRQRRRSATATASSRPAGWSRTRCITTRSSKPR